MRTVFLGVLLMVLTVGDSVRCISQRDGDESAQKDPPRVDISGEAREGKPAIRAEGLFKRYVGLGDSISIDEYAGGPGWGAISLFYRNRDEIYPEWKGRDLRSLYPGIDLYSLASDGATSGTVLREQLLALPSGDDDPTIVTLTVGGNDFLFSLGLGGGIDRGAIDRFRLDLKEILKTLRERYPNCTIILATIYDPTDGVGDLGMPEVDVQEGYALFHAFNRAILDIGKSHGVHIADIYSHFLGHGSHHGDPGNPHYCPEDPSRWFVQEIEPNARGAHEVRRKFWEALERRGLRG
ncbi:MAG: SGNH/GDSL hydrolase family protein [Syntrophobacterales bacterium]|nr:MAG: SGNH/GDSL hydrolase family protein [Syntrophobacterales bacterium]